MNGDPRLIATPIEPDPEGIHALAPELLTVRIRVGERLENKLTIGVKPFNHSMIRVKKPHRII